MPRAMWTGAISFGLVTVPVKLYTAVQSKSVRFNQLDAEDHSRVQMKRVNAATGEEVPFDRIVKGFEVAPDRYVVVEPSELEALDPKKTKTIDIDGFVDLEEIDPVYYDHAYYLVPGTGGAKPYRLLVDAMRETNKVAVAKVVIRQKEQLVALRAAGDVLAMATMNFPDELVDPASFDEVPSAEDVDANPRELKMAQQLVESLTEPFEPTKYHDTYREQVLKMIEQKAAGEEVTVQAAAPEVAAAPDLMSALKASLDAVRERTGGDSDAPAPKKPTARKRATTTSAAKKDDAPKKPASSRRKPAAKS